MSDEFEVYAEWIIRRLRELDPKSADAEKIIKWVLYSLGVKDIGVKIYLYLREKRRATTTEIAEKFSISPATARRYLEQLHSLGLVDYIGREYHITREDLSGSIREILIPRIRRVLNFIADVAEHADKQISGEKTRELSRDIEDIIEQAKEKALRDIELKFKDIDKVTPQMISEIVSKTFDMISKALSSSISGATKTMFLHIPKPPKPPIVKGFKPKIKTKFLRPEGISIAEYDDRIVYDVFEDYELDSDILIAAKNKNKHIILRVYGNLHVSKDLDPSLAKIIKVLEVYGDLIAPKEFIVNVQKLSVYGTIRFI